MDSTGTPAFVRAILAFCLTLLGGSPAGAQSLLDLDPRHVGPGATVTILGLGFDPLADHTVTLNGLEAAVVSIDETSIGFQVPQNASTGLLVVTPEEGAAIHYPFPFPVTRPAVATFADELSAISGDYIVGTMYGDSPDASGPFDIVVAKGDPSLVVGTPGDPRRIVTAIALDGDAQVELSAMSTVQAMIFLVPGIYTEDPVAGAEALAHLATYPEAQQAAALVEAHLVAGTDYLNDPAVRVPIAAAMNRLVSDVLLPPDEARLARHDSPEKGFITGPRGFRSGHPRKLTVPRLANVESLVVEEKETPNDEYGLPRVGMNFEPAVKATVGPLEVKGNPLDWIGNLYELDHTRFDRATDLDTLPGSEEDVYFRTIDQPYLRNLVPSTPVGSNLNLMDFLGQSLRKSVYDPIAKTPGEDVMYKLEADRPAVYIARLFSGAVFEPFEQLVEDLPGSEEDDSYMFAHNVVMSVTEFAVIPLKAYNLYGAPLSGGEGRGRLEKLLDILQSGFQTMLRDVALNGASPRTVLAFVGGLYEKLIDVVFKEAASSAADFTAVPDVVDFLLGTYELAVDMAQPVNRLTALTNWVDFAIPGTEAYAGLSVESAIAVVGDPWQPEVTSFEPRIGYRGTQVRLHGLNFSTDESLNLVRFGGLTTDPEDPGSGAPATVVGEATTSSLRVVVPEGAADGSNPIEVAVTGKGSTTTLSNDPPFQTFEVIPDPVITGLNPAAPVANTYMIVQGMNFHPDLAKNAFEVENPGTIDEYVPLAGDTTSLMVAVPNSIVPNRVRVVIEGRPSNWWDFTPVLPPTFSGGTQIAVTSAGDDDSFDGDVTLREAILIAKGERSVSEGEAEHICCGSPGIGTREWIMIPEFIPDSGGLPFVVNLQSELPPLGPADQFDGKSSTIDGSALSNGENGFILDGVTETLVNGMNVRNMPGHGFVFRNGAAFNYINGGFAFVGGYDTVVEGCGGDGIRVEDGSHSNFIAAVTVRDNDGDGIRITGPGTVLNSLHRYNEFAFPPIGPWSIEGNGGYGVLVDGGATFNLVEPSAVNGNALGGIRIDGPDTRFNCLGARSEFNSLGYADVLDNGGPGIWITAPDTSVRNFNSAGHDGDGVLVDGARNVLVNRMRIGYGDDDPSMPVDSPNMGSGIRVTGGASKIVLGGRVARAGDFPSFRSRVYTGGNRDYGVLVEGAATHDVKVSLLYAGYVDHGASAAALLGVAEPVGLAAHGNGLGGIAVMGGATDVEIGDTGYVNRVIVADHAAGDGILIAGSGTSDVRVYNAIAGTNYFGDTGLGNLNGIRIADGAQSNTIGLLGDLQLSEFFEDAPESMSYNIVQGNTNGIVLESGGTVDGTIVPGQPVPTPQGSNVVQNNYIGRAYKTNDPETDSIGNEVGILIRPGATANRIGGVDDAARNFIHFNRRAGIEIDGVVSTVPALANRIVGNDIQRNGVNEVPTGDPLANEPRGVGVLIGGGSCGQIVGGPGARVANEFRSNHVGVMIQGDQGNDDDGGHVVTGNLFSANRTAGLMIRHATGVVVGPNNEFVANGRAILGLAAPIPSGGIAIAGGGTHELYGNRIGTNLSHSNSEGFKNVPHGIAIHDSADNVVGGLGLEKPNIIVRNEERGVAIMGSSAAGNRIRNNLIGVLPGRIPASAPNGTGGVLIADGAHDNLIGGRAEALVNGATVSQRAGNAIRANLGPGVAVGGAATTGNAITNNSISAHAGFAGIELSDGGNDLVAPPLITLVSDGTNVSGTTLAPDGSEVQIFRDPDEEGLIFVATTIVSGGAFDASAVLPLPPSRVTATVTHPDGNTSEFSPVYVYDPPDEPGLDIRRNAEPPVERAVPANVPALLAAIRLTTGDNGATVINESITISAEGTADESAALAALQFFADTNGNGTWDPSDQLVSVPQNPPSVDDGSVTLDVEFPLPSETIAVIFLVADLNGSGGVGETIVFRVSSADDVYSRAILPEIEVDETGGFPLVTDTLILQESILGDQFGIY